MARLKLSFLGPMQVELNDETDLAFGYDKVRGLLAYLAVESDRSHARERLAGLFWPEFSNSSALKNLSQALFRLRRAIRDRDRDPSCFLVTRSHIQFSPVGDYWLDVRALSDSVRRLLHRSHPPPAHPDNHRAYAPPKAR